MICIRRTILRSAHTSSFPLTRYNVHLCRRRGILPGLQSLHISTLLYGQKEAAGFHVSWEVCSGCGVVIYHRALKPKFCSIMTTINQAEVKRKNETWLMPIPWAYLLAMSLQVKTLERDAIEVLSLVRTMRNGFAPINRIPPEVFSLVPKHWSHAEMDKNLITLTHVCCG